MELAGTGLGEFDGGTHLTDKLSSLSLEQTLRKYRNLQNKKAYYVGDANGGVRLFGIDGSSSLFRISDEIYRKIGMPEAGEIIPLSCIIEKAGYSLSKP